MTVKTTTLKCDVIAVRGITSRVDIDWVIIDEYYYTMYIAEDFRVTVSFESAADHQLVVDTDQLVTNNLKKVEVTILDDEAYTDQLVTDKYTIMRKVEDVTANIVNNSAVYTDQLVIPPLSVNDSGGVYYCRVSINSTFEVISNATVLDFIGKYTLF